VTAAYGLIFPQALLDVPRHGAINVHASLLPRWRGAAPIQRALLAGDAVTGVSIMQMDAGLDTGPVLLRVETAVSGSDTSGTLTDRLAARGAELVVGRSMRSSRVPSAPSLSRARARAMRPSSTSANSHRLARNRRCCGAARARVPSLAGAVARLRGTELKNLERRACRGAREPGEVLAPTRAESASPAGRVP